MREASIGLAGDPRAGRRPAPAPPRAPAPAVARGAALDLAADVLHRLERAHARDHVEVVLRRRRGREPLQRVALPRVGAGDGAARQRAHDVDDRDEHAGAEDEGADRRDLVVELEVADVVVLVDAARHAVEAERVLDQERDERAEEHQPARPRARAPR